MASLPSLYNTLTRTTQAIVPREPGKVTIYCCGPTTYDVPHAGHARAALAPDILVRVLKSKGARVVYARNVTDVDDKILQRARERGEEPLELSRRMTDIYRQDMAELGCEVPDFEPKVSEHIAEIVALVERLIELGSAYAVDRPSGVRDVYFSVRSFAGYGKLSRRKVDELLVGARVESDELKRDPLDFALWKGATPDEWGWSSPWGRGRPGWHIECSAMSGHLLGHGFDVHAGGMDLIFPHHENEIAQSEAAAPEKGPFARIWMHNGFVNVDKEKMSKSLGNFVTIRDVLERNDAEAFRLFLLTVQYRGPLQFDTETLGDGRVVFPGVDEAEQRVDYLYTTRTRLEALMASGLTAPQRLPEELVKLKTEVERAEERAFAGLFEDLNTPVALAGLSELCRLGNELCDLTQRRRKDNTFVAAGSSVAHGILQALGRLTSVLGLMRAPAEAYRARTRARRIRLRGLTEEAIEQKVAERTRARESKDFAAADALRAELTALGINVSDEAGTTHWTIAP